jgi:hypothetical protein
MLVAATEAALAEEDPVLARGWLSLLLVDPDAAARALVVRTDALEEEESDRAEALRKRAKAAAVAQRSRQAASWEGRVAKLVVVCGQFSKENFDRRNKVYDLEQALDPGAPEARATYEAWVSEQEAEAYGAAKSRLGEIKAEMEAQQKLGVDTRSQRQQLSYAVADHCNK